jgi:SPP1 gp7 family putative phage head morphogenesis protein
VPIPEVFPVRRGIGRPALDEATTWRSQRAREARKEKRVFYTAQRAELEYSRKLRSIAHQIGVLCRFYDPGNPSTSSWVVGALRRYAEALWPWAVAVSERMLIDVQRRDEKAWAKYSINMGRALAQEVRSAPTGELMRQLLNEQASLITSLPIDAAHRVHEWTMRGLEGSERPEKVAEEIYQTGLVTRSRATLIGRTEVARTASKLVEARARWVGSTHYQWVTAGDADVRSGHRKLNGKIVSWDDPPIAGNNGMRYHAGQGPNCRCIPMPLVPEDIL